jgi:hypothetical protein
MNLPNVSCLRSVASDSLTTSVLSGSYTAPCRRQEPGKFRSFDFERWPAAERPLRSCLVHNHGFWVTPAECENDCGCVACASNMLSDVSRTHDTYNCDMSYSNGVINLQSARSLEVLADREFELNRIRSSKGPHQPGHAMPGLCSAWKARTNVQFPLAKDLASDQ